MDMFFRRVLPTPAPPVPLAPIIVNPYRPNPQAPAFVPNPAPAILPSLPDPDSPQYPTVYALYTDLLHNPPVEQAQIQPSVPTTPPQLSNLPFPTTPPSEDDDDQSTTSLQPRTLFNELSPENSVTAIATNIFPDPTVPPLPIVDPITRWREMFNYHHNYRHPCAQPVRQEASLSTTNLRNNLPWGDVMSLEKPPDTIRLYSQNVNGIRLDDTGGDLTSISVMMQELGCDIVGFSEVRLDVSKYSVKKIISSTFHRHFQGVKYAAATSSIPFTGYYKPGGTMTAAFNSVTSRCRGQINDPLGRWSTLSLNGRHGRVVHFITIYQVVAKGDSGPSSASEQQRVLLLLDNRQMKPRKAFITDFSRYLTSLEDDVSSFVVMGDFNEVVGLDPSGFAKISTKFGLIDIHAHYHSLDDEVPTYARGTQRLDFVFCSESLIGAVKASGVEPFNQHIFSDHRAVFVDWHEELLFGSKTPTIAARSQRRLQSTSIQSKSRYIQLLSDYCDQKNITKRLVRLHSHPSPRRAEQIDRDVTAGMLMAESRCRSLGQDPWSLKLKEARLLVSVFQHCHSMSTTRLDVRPKLVKLLAAYALPVDIPDDPEAIRQCLRAARQALHQVRLHAVKHRKEFLALKVEAAMILRDPNRKEFKRIMQAEEMKALYAKLRFCRNGGAPNSGLNRLDVPVNRLDDPKKCTEWMSVDTPAAITEYLMERNRLHFGQAAGTPFTVSPLSLQVDFGASTEACQLMLTGGFDDSELDDLTALLVQHFQALTTLDVLPATITAQAMMDKYRAWPESTSTSPSGRHLGHYRSLLTPLKDTNPATPESLDLDAKRRGLIDMHHSLLAYSLEHSHSYVRWQKVVNVMLEKDPGDPKIHRLRVIHLYEADYNLLLGIKWRELIHHCEDNHLLHQSLYGARPGRGAHDPVFIEELTAEITRLSRKPLIKNAEDATACYDRIIPGVGNLASRCHGLHRHIAIVQGSTLEEVRYHLKTQLGVSDESYKHCSISPIYGTGQGSGNSPIVWLVISSILFTCYESKAFGARFESADRSVCIDIFRVGFVDDTCGYVNQFSSDMPPKPDEMISLLIHDSQLWSDLLWKTGGSLELPKCTYHYWQYSFSKEGRPVLEGCRIGPPVVLRTGDGQHTQTVPFCSTYKAYKTLGCYKSPIGTQKTQHKVLKAKCDLHARIVSTSALSKREAVVYYYSMYLTSPGYPLPVCHFSPGELKKLETKSLPAIISRSGYNRTTARRIMYGPTRLNGAGLRPFETEQGVGQLQFFYKYWHYPLEPGQLLRIAVSWAQVNVGVGFSIFEDVVSPLPHFESRWLRSVRAFLKSIGGKLRLDTPFVPAIQRINDSFIMDHVLLEGSFTDGEVQRINYCRLYLQVVTVSDISTATGDIIVPGIEDGQVQLWASTTKYHKTNQGNPNKPSWKLWKKALRLFSHPNGKLHIPLRQWIHPPSQQRQQWPVYFDPNKDAILFAQAGRYEYHLQGAGVFDYKMSGTLLVLPSTAYPVTILETERGWVVEAWSSYCPTPVVAIPTDFTSFCSSLESWEQQLLKNMELHFPPDTLAAMISSSSFRVCSDGSAMTLQGTYGWSLSLKDGTRLAHGAGPVEGHDPQSFRAEGQGMLAVVCFLSRIRQWTNSPHPFRGVLATDNTGLLTRVKEQRTYKYDVPNNVFKPDWDIVDAIVKNIAPTNLTVTFLHVPGHQDRDTPVEQLDLMGQLNVEADQYAGEYQTSHGAYRPQISLTPYRPIALDIDGQTIHRGFKQAVREAAHTNDLFEAMQLRYDWPDGTLETIDWEAHRQSTQPHAKLRKAHYVKLCHEMLPVGDLVASYGQSLPDYCFLCRTPNEDHVHILRCLHPTRIKWRTQLLESLRTTCREYRSDPVLMDILIQGITHWLDGTHFDETTFPERFHPLLREQHVIGWKHMFQGRASREWAKQQQIYLCSIRYIKGQDGANWIKLILSQIFTQWNKLWDCRNSERHGKDQKAKAKLLKDQAIRELEVLYTLRDNVLHRDRTLFFDDITLHTAQPTRTIRQWILTYKPLLLKSAKDAKTNSILNVRTIQSYYGNQG